MELFQQCLELFHKGGPVMYLLALCSLAVVTIAVERGLYYRQCSANAAGFAARLNEFLDGRQWEQAQQYCDQAAGVIGTIAARGFRAFARGEDIESTLAAASMLEAAQLRERMKYLSAIVTMAPLLGLLGTVIGMIHSFSVFNLQAGQPMAITGGVGEALIATATGLVVAVMALIVHVYFSHRLDGIITDIEQICALLTIRLGRAQARRGEEHETA